MNLVASILVLALEAAPSSCGTAALSGDEAVASLREELGRRGIAVTPSEDAATIVVHQREAERNVRTRVSSVAPVVPVRRLSQEDQAALIALAARASSLTSERLDELAALAAVVSGDGGRSGPDITRRVLGVAEWALGRR